VQLHALFLADAAIQSLQSQFVLQAAMAVARHEEYMSQINSEKLATHFYDTEAKLQDEIQALKKQVAELQVSAADTHPASQAGH